MSSFGKFQGKTFDCFYKNQPQSKVLSVYYTIQQAVKDLSLALAQCKCTGAWRCRSDSAPLKHDRLSDFIGVQWKSVFCLHQAGEAVCRNAQINIDLQLGETDALAQRQYEGISKNTIHINIP